MEAGAISLPQPQKCKRRRNTKGQRTRIYNKPPTMEIPKDMVDPCKVYVSNLGHGITEHTLKEAMSAYAQVQNVIIIKDKRTGRSKGTGFVKVETEEDVQKLLALNEADRYIHGQKIVICLAKKKIYMPGERGYVRRELSDRDFDLESLNPSQVSIHMLPNDVMYKVFSYLPLRTIIKCERVCRRWQMFVHQHCAMESSLEISEASLSILSPITGSAISKLFILYGPNLKILTLKKVLRGNQKNILMIIGQLCPQLEYLDISGPLNINFKNLRYIQDGCKNIKGFTISKCYGFNDSMLRKLLSCYPNLEKLKIIEALISARSFDSLPHALKVLCLDTLDEDFDDGKVMKHIAERCSNLESLQITNHPCRSQDLELVGKSCSKLSELSICLPMPNSVGVFASLSKLKELVIEARFIDLPQLFVLQPQLEILTIKCGGMAFHGEMENLNTIDFSTLENLRVLKIVQTICNHDSLMSVTKCKNLEELHFMHTWAPFDTKIILLLLKKCTKFKRFSCANWSPTKALLEEMDETVGKRGGKVVLEMFCPESEIDQPFALSHIKLEFSKHPNYDYDDYYSDLDSEASDRTFECCLFNSDDDFFFEDDDYYCDDLLRAALLVASLGEPDDDFY